MKRGTATRLARGVMTAVSSVLVSAALLGCPFRIYRPLATRIPPGGNSTTCPFGLRGIRVYTVDTDLGIEVTLTTGTQSEELRRRAHAIVTKYTGDAGDARAIADDEPLHGKVHASVKDVTDGARIRLDAINPKDTEGIRAEVMGRVNRARTSGECD